MRYQLAMKLDPVLFRLFNAEFSHRKVSQLSSIFVDTISEILNRFNKTGRKLAYSGMLKE